MVGRFGGVNGIRDASVLVILSGICVLVESVDSCVSHCSTVSMWVIDVLGGTSSDVLFLLRENGYLGAVLLINLWSSSYT